MLQDIDNHQNNWKANNIIYYHEIDESLIKKCMKAPIVLSAYASVVTEWLDSSYSAYTKYCLCQIPVHSICTIVHNSKLIAEKFCSILVKGLTLCKYHKQLHPHKCILCGFLSIAPQKQYNWKTINSCRNDQLSSQEQQTAPIDVHFLN